MCNMLLSGIQPFTLIDYPGKTACIVFTGGCNFRCGYCHNPEFVLPERLAELKGSFIPPDAFFNFLRTRQGLLDGVVVSGGEPTMMPDLLTFLGHIKFLGFSVKLDTNGNRPDIVKEAIARGLIDYVAMDFKTSLAEYQTLVGNRADPKKIAESVQILKSGIIEYEFRSTLIKQVHPEETISQMQAELAGAKNLYLQTFRPATTLNPIFQSYTPFSSDEMSAIAAKFRPVIHNVFIR